MVELVRAVRGQGRERGADPGSRVMAGRLALAWRLGRRRRHVIDDPDHRAFDREDVALSRTDRRTRHHEGGTGRNLRCRARVLRSADAKRDEHREPRGY